MRITAGGILRGGVILLVWLVVAFVLAMLVHRVQVGEISDILPWITAFVAIPAALMFSRLIARAHVRIEFGLEPGHVPAPARERLKNSDRQHGDLRDMLHLLNEDDLDDLRAELREAMRARIRGLTGEADFESFENLLTEPAPRERAKRG